MDQQQKIELSRKIQDAFVVDRLKDTPAWKLVMEACEVATADATHRLIYDKLIDPVEIARIQERIKIYSGFLSGLISYLKYGGDQAIKEANDEGISLEELF